jgi:hypothetical protein
MLLNVACATHDFQWIIVRMMGNNCEVSIPKLSRPKSSIGRYPVTIDDARSEKLYQIPEDGHRPLKPPKAPSIADLSSRLPTSLLILLLNAFKVVLVGH